MCILYHLLLSYSSNGLQGGVFFNGLLAVLQRIYSAVEKNNTNVMLERAIFGRSDATVC